MSDLYIRNDRDAIEANPARGTEMPGICLDGNFYKKIDSFLARFPEGVPSLMECSNLCIEGDVLFEKGVKCVGDVRIINTGLAQGVIKAGTVLNGEIKFGVM